MKKPLPIILFAVFSFALCLQPAAAPAQVQRFDADGLAINAEQYEDAAAARQKVVTNQLADGYQGSVSEWKDPIKTRQKRITQWRTMRSQYDPESLPHKIEDAKSKE